MRSSKGEHGPVLIDFLLHINADLSNRVVEILSGFTPSLEVYS
ncbi:MAG: DNA polymerase V subunit UmuC, partial [Pseudomonas sp.]